MRSKALTAKKLIVTAVDESYPGESSSYEFPVWEFENGLILVPSDSTNDYFFEDRESIQASGLAFVSEVQDTEITDRWESSFLLKTIQRSIKEFGVDSVPKKHFELWKIN